MITSQSVEYCKCHQDLGNKFKPKISLFNNFLTNSSLFLRNIETNFHRLILKYFVSNNIHSKHL